MHPLCNSITTPVLALADKPKKQMPQTLTASRLSTTSPVTPAESPFPTSLLSFTSRRINAFPRFKLGFS